MVKGNDKKYSLLLINHLLQSHPGIVLQRLEMVDFLKIYFHRYECPLFPKKKKPKTPNV